MIENTVDIRQWGRLGHMTPANVESPTITIRGEGRARQCLREGKVVVYAEEI